MKFGTAHPMAGPMIEESGHEMVMMIVNRQNDQFNLFSNQLRRHFPAGDAALFHVE